MAELKPCPFCGEEAQLYSMKQEKRKILGVYYKIATIRCTGLCTAQVSQAGPTEIRAYENAAKMWNRRADGERRTDEG